MADDFIVEEETSNRTFLYAVIGMGAIFVIGLIIVVVMILTGRNGNQATVIANMTTEAENQLVTLTVAQMQREEAYTATFTPSPPPATSTLPPTFTPSPVPPTVTPTPVLQTPEAGEADAVAPEVTATAEVAPTAGADGPAGGQLPASGLGLWGAVVAAAALLVVIFVARRFRPAA